MSWLRAWWSRRKLRRLFTRARAEYAALPTRQLRRQARRKASKRLGWRQAEAITGTQAATPGTQGGTR